METEDPVSRSPRNGDGADTKVIKEKGGIRYAETKDIIGEPDWGKRGEKK